MIFKLVYGTRIIVSTILHVCMKMAWIARMPASAALKKAPEQRGGQIPLTLIHSSFT